MQTLPANNEDQKGPARDDSVEKPTEQDPDKHNPPLKAPSDNDGGARGSAEFHGASTNHNDGAAVSAAEGEVAHTPQGP
jgi:hypothetical protein